MSKCDCRNHDGHGALLPIQYSAFNNDHILSEHYALTRMGHKRLPVGRHANQKEKQARTAIARKWSQMKIS